MGARLGVVRAGAQPAAVLAAQSRAVLDRALRCPAELWLAIASDDATVLGAFQRGDGMPREATLLRRGSGGAEVRVATGTVHVLVALQAPSALVPCDEKRIVNRYVRPLLRGLTRCGHLAHHFGRDWVSVGKEPVASVGFAHDASTGRAAFEAFVAVGAPFALRARPSFLGKRPAALVGADPLRLLEAIAAAYAEGADVVALAEPDVPETGDDSRADPPWAATHEEVIGLLGAGRDAQGVFRVGGDLLCSRDALARLEAGATATSADIGELVDRTLGARGVALDGVRSLASVRDVVTAALALQG
jgi:hypothetical protein